MSEAQIPDTSEPEYDASAIRVGVAGWSYADWRGIVYGPTSKSSRPELGVIASLVDVVEINSTFYRYPESRSADRWLKIVEPRPDFLFTAKVCRELTHERDVNPDALRSGCIRLLEGLAPLREAGRIDTLLAQFPPWFRDGPAARARISALVEALQPMRVVIEIRHPSFLRRVATPDLAASGRFLAFLEALGAGFANIDLPAGRGSVPATTINTAAIGYVRLHGRNVKAWYDPRAGRDEKYDYLYSSAELEAWVDIVRRLLQRTRRTYVITNNHFRGQAVANALELAQRLGKSGPTNLPPSLLEAYPGLQSLSGSANSPSRGRDTADDVASRRGP